MAYLSQIYEISTKVQATNSIITMKKKFTVIPKLLKHFQGAEQVMYILRTRKHISSIQHHLKERKLQCLSTLSNFGYTRQNQEVANQANWKQQVSQQHKVK